MSYLHQINVDINLLIKEWLSNKLNYFNQASTTKSSKKVPLFFYTLYIEGEGSEGSGEGEVSVRVNIKDVNDNPPVFEAQETEIVASVPTTAQYGHHVTRIQVSVLCHACLSLICHRLICDSFDDTNPKVSLFITEMLVSRSFKHWQQDSAMHISISYHLVTKSPSQNLYRTALSWPQFESKSAA